MTLPGGADIINNMNQVDLPEYLDDYPFEPRNNVHTGFVRLCICPLRALDGLMLPSNIHWSLTKYIKER